MTRLLPATSLTAALTIAVPVSAQAPTTAEALNREVLNQLIAATAAPVAAAPAVVYSVAVARPAAAVPQDNPQLVQPNSTPGQYPFAYLYPYYGYQPLNTYAYINVGSSGYYAPIDVSVSWGWE